MQQGGRRGCIGGITVSSHSSVTSKGSPLVHPLARAPVLPAPMQLSIFYMGTGTMVKLNGLVS